MSGWALAGKNRTRDIVLLLNAWILVFSTWSLVFHSVSSPFRTGRTDRQTIHRTIYILRSELTAKRHTELYTYYIANWPPIDTQIFLHTTKIQTLVAFEMPKKSSWGWIVMIWTKTIRPKTVIGWWTLNWDQSWDEGTHVTTSDPDLSHQVGLQLGEPRLLRLTTKK